GWLFSPSGRRCAGAAGTPLQNRCLAPFYCAPSFVERVQDVFLGPAVKCLHKAGALMWHGFGPFLEALLLWQELLALFAARWKEQPDPTPCHRRPARYAIAP